jgi:radical SAM superfamily enzyme
VEQADEPTKCGEVARGGCTFASNCSVTRSTLLNKGGEKD